MNQYYVIEIQNNADGTSGNFVWGFANRNDAEEKFHFASAYAAKSTVLVHTVVMLTRTGTNVKNESYTHPVEPEPEPEPQRRISWNSRPFGRLFHTISSGGTLNTFRPITLTGRKKEE